MIPLVCIDVDGTLVGSSGEPSSAVWSAVDAALDRGQHLALSTARGAFGPTLGYARRLDPDGWHVFHAGAALVHTGTNDIVADALDDDVIARIVAAANQHRWVVEHYSPGDYTVDSDDRLAIDHAALQGVPYRRSAPAGLRGPVVRMQVVVPDVEVPAVQQALAHEGALSVASSPAMVGVAFVSITRPCISKATAIATIADRLGVSMAQTMMVGDGHNDLDAIRVVGHGVAMGNAVDEVIAAARYRVGHVDADGLAAALDLSARL